MAEGPDVVGGGAEVAAELIAAAEVLVGRVDGLGSGVELGDPGDRSGVSLAGLLPDRAGLAVEVFAPQPDLVGDRRVGAARPRGFEGAAGAGSIAGASEFRRSARRGLGRVVPGRMVVELEVPVGRLRRLGGGGAAVELEVAQAAVAGGGRPEFLDGVGLAHQLAERLAAMAVEFEDGRSPFGLGRQFADHAGDARKAQPTRRPAGGAPKRPPSALGPAPARRPAGQGFRARGCLRSGRRSAVSGSP